MSRFTFRGDDPANPAEPFWPQQANLPREVILKPYPNVPRNTLDAAILAEMHKSQIVGISAAFVEGSRVSWANGYGWADLAAGRSARADTIYRIASISKTITATALMQLWEQGRFRLDDDIGGYLGYPVRNPHYPLVKITFHMLLTHTSSILDTGGYAAALSATSRPPLREILVPGGAAYSSATWDDHPPGTQFNYSNFSVGIIGALVEVLSGEPFDHYAREHIFRPLGMDASYAAADLVSFQKLAVLYRASGGGRFTPSFDYYPEGERPPRRVSALPLGNYYIGPAGAVRASVLDLAKFMIAHMNGGVYNGVRILRRATVDLMHQIQWYGFGLEGFFRQMGLIFHITNALAGRRLTGHYGDAYGLLSAMNFDRDEFRGVIFITNGGYYQFVESGFSNIEQSVINHIYARLAVPPKPLPLVITAVPGDSKLMAGKRQVFYQVAPDAHAGDLFTPAVTLADALEAAIDFDRESNTMTLVKSGIVLTARPGDRFLKAGDERIDLSIPVYSKAGYIMLPLIKVLKAFGSVVTCHPTGNIAATLMPGDRGVYPWS
ncbi:MAG: putative penicillin-binding protein PbpX [Pelotomaculum sp. PtaB.Bin104]|nr:MAG: putative penicillin-binding protein PbpX [Pelotomaculum sp. PtaB.Bin104]